MMSGLQSALYSLRIFFLFCLIGFVALPSCKKESDSQDRIPYVPVNLILYSSEPGFFPLSTPGGWIYTAGGSKGLIVYRKTMDEFVVLERHCPYTPSNSCSRVSINSSQILAVDSCCGSEFVIADGSISKGPATLPLLRYSATFDGHRLLIQN